MLKIILLEDQELWSLLNGYGPHNHSRPARNMTQAERTEFLFLTLKNATSNVSAKNLRLVLEEY